MATITLSPDPRFPPGTTLYAYNASGDARPTSPNPVTSAAVSGDSTTTFTGLDAGRYVAGETVNGPFVAFTLELTSGSTGGSGDLGPFGSFDLIEDPDTGWPARPENAQAGTWIGWTDPTELMFENDRFIAIPFPT